jgi:hypothetical protein
MTLGAVAWRDHGSGREKEETVKGGETKVKSMELKKKEKQKQGLKKSKEGENN